MTDLLNTIKFPENCEGLTVGRDLRAELRALNNPKVNAIPNALMCGGILNIIDVWNLSDERLLEVKGIGKVNISYLNTAVSQLVLRKILGASE